MLLSDLGFAWLELDIRVDGIRLRASSVMLGLGELGQRLDVLILGWLSWLSWN